MVYNEVAADQLILKSNQKQLSYTRPNATENRLFMLTCLMLADELVETRKVAQQVRIEDEQLMVAAVDHLRQRILSISKVVGKYVRKGHVQTDEHWTKNWKQAKLIKNGEN